MAQIQAMMVEVIDGYLAKGYAMLVLFILTLGPVQQQIYVKVTAFPKYIVRKQCAYLIL